MTARVREKSLLMQRTMFATIVAVAIMLALHAIVLAWPLDPQEFRDRVRIQRQVMRDNADFDRPVQDAAVPAPEKTQEVTVGQVTYAVPSSLGVATGVVADNRPTLQVMLPSGRELRIIRGVRPFLWLSLSDKETIAMLQTDLSADERRALIEERFRTDEQLAEWIGSLTVNDLTGERTAEQIVKLNAMVLVMKSHLKWRVPTRVGNAYMSAHLVRLRDETRADSGVFLYDKAGKLILFLAGRITYPKAESPVDTNEIELAMMSIVAGIQSVEPPAEAVPSR